MRISDWSSDVCSSDLLTMKDRQLLQSGDDFAIISYRAEVTRADVEPYMALVRSAYVRRSHGWKLAFHQHSPVWATGLASRAGCREPRMEGAAPLPADTQPAPLIGITSAASLCTGAFPVPIGAKIVAGVAVAYDLSPIDLLPDFIPVLGYFDDLILVPTDLWLAIRPVPPALMPEFGRRADT